MTCCRQLLYSYILSTSLLAGSLALRDNCMFITAVFFTFLSICLCIGIFICMYQKTLQLDVSRSKKRQHSSCVYTYKHTIVTISCAFNVFTGSIAHSANLPVFSLLRGWFWGFSPRRGDMLHRWGWNLAWRRGHAKFHPHRCNDKGVRPPKLKFLLRFDRNLEHKRPAGAYPLHNFHKICRVCTSFQAALGVKIWLDLLKGLWSYGGFKLRGPVPPNF